MQKENEDLAPKEEPTILYEEDGLLAVNKPAGLMVHPDGKNTDPTLCDWLVGKYPAIKGVGEPLVLVDGREIDRPGIVHRLDRWTSGVLLVAKTQKVHAFLKEQFQGREIKKEYNTFVFGLVKNDFGTINLPLGRSKGDFRQYTAPPNARGEMREAETYYEVVFRGKEHTFVKVQPKTGRTHQIRVHMKALGYPVVCDRVYALNRGTALGFERLALHARKVSFRNEAGDIKTVEAPFPQDFGKALLLLQEEVLS